MRNRLSIAAPLFLLTLFLGCGSSKDAADTRKWVWPEPPDEARIEYLKTFRNENDFSSALGVLGDIVGGKGAKFQLQRPFDLASDGKGSVYVTDVSQGVFVFDEPNKEVRVLGEKVPISMGSPRGIAFGNNKVFVGIQEAGQVVVLTPDGTFLNAIGKQGQFPNPVDVAYDKVNQRVIVVDNKLHQVLLFSETGDSLLVIGTRGEGDGEFNFPQSAAVDAAGNIYIVDAFNFRIQEFDRNGTYLRQFGKQGNIFGTFARPKGIAIDSYGNIYVTDAVHQNFQIFNTDFELLMFVGRLSDDNGGFENPVGIDIDSTNTIYVADHLNARVQVFKLLKGN